MDEKYTRWTTNIVARYDGNVYAKCVEVTEEMVKEFPELRRVRGHVRWSTMSKMNLRNGQPHWWLENKAWEIIDPTVSQFPPGDELFYEEHMDGDPEPSGKCMDCGAYVYDGDTFCNEACETATKEYLGI